ncbi:conserved hypothetical protein [Culex quinquefasciatus]|nr:conserved hypothetical protein [Culex quinquefasciatus]|eukprot:XP_001869501.1 conserved hypothetical protein [Culex quinquefasciatus]
MGLDYGARLWSVDCVLAMLDESSSRVDVFFMNWINDESVTDYIEQKHPLLGNSGNSLNPVTSRRTVMGGAVLGREIPTRAYLVERCVVHHYLFSVLAILLVTANLLLKVLWMVAWVRVDTQTILSIHHNVITQNPRISLTYNDHRSWYLHIREVEESDRGWYMCQVNTDPMRSRKGYLQVVVPPAIVESMTSNDMVVREGTNVSLTCKAKGFPEPYVMWRREDGDEMAIGGENEISDSDHQSQSG